MATEGQTVRIAVDAMGGDYAPSDVVKGALLAAEQEKAHILLVGDPEVLERELAGHDLAHLPVQPVPSEGVIQEGESPTTALRQKPKASVMVAAQLVKMGKADAFVSMGSTGATMASAIFSLGLLEGVERPTLGGPFLGLAPNTLFLDLGTTLDCRPSQLLSFGVIGAVLATTLLNIPNPRVALLSVGAEETKGNRQVREAHELFRASDLNFVGNVEGNDLLENKADVVICDGFVGNILMKLSEGLGGALSRHLATALEGRLSPPEVEQLAAEMYRLTNVAEYGGGGPLLGVKGVAIVGHGRSRAPSVKRAIAMARWLVQSHFVPLLEERLART